MEGDSPNFAFIEFSEVATTRLPKIDREEALPPRGVGVRRCALPPEQAAQKDPTEAVSRPERYVGKANPEEAPRIGEMVSGAKQPHGERQDTPTSQSS